VLMRGYILNNLMTGMNKYLALLLSSSIFGLLHLLNDGVTVLAMVNLILAGILLGSSYIFTKNLWFPISLHLFWNFFQGPVLGYSVSGMKVNPIFTLSSTGNELFTGGEFGFEGSIVCTVLLVTATAAVIGYYGKKTAAAKEVQLAYQEIG
jgi:membrane protease YdiL (CAAX protease family)